MRNSKMFFFFQKYSVFLIEENKIKYDFNFFNDIIKMLNKVEF